MTDELKILRELRDAAKPYTRIIANTDGIPELVDSSFYFAAHAALGENGCITRELERLRTELQRRSSEAREIEACGDPVVHELQIQRRDLEAELSALKTQHEALVAGIRAWLLTDCDSWALEQLLKNEPE